ncbi:MAG: LysR family transcriptional regulator [Phycisphaeraceae bacterium]|nr:LysR family transcriptional regulator [Phycisphaeraceae bacterium]
MELTQLRYFREIAKSGHMTKAARTLGVSQPALSAMLRKLEAEVGTSLLHRTGKGVELSEAGKVFLRHADESVRRADEGLHEVRRLSGLETGSIRAGAGATAASYILPSVVSDMRRAHPGLKFYVREMGSSAIVEAILNGELDLGIVTLPVRNVGAKQLVLRSLVDDELRLITPPRHKLAKETSFRWSDLKGESVIGFEAGSAVREVVDQAAAASGVTLDVVMELRSIQSIQQMVAAGVGVGFVSRLSDAPKRLPSLTPKSEPLVRELAIVRRSDHTPSTAVAEFERRLLKYAETLPGFTPNKKKRDI